MSENQPRDDEGKPASPGACRRRAQRAPADQDARGLGPGAQPSYRNDTPPRRPPAGRIRVDGIGTAPMSTTEYQDAVEAVAVLIARRDAQHADAA